MTKILCLESKKSGKKYHVLSINDVYVFVPYDVLYKVALSVNVSNIDIHDMNIGDEIEI